MGEDEICRFGGKKKANGNCTNPDPDGFPNQSVGPWAETKHNRLRLYLEATRAVRAKFVGPGAKGGAAFIDLFAGPGRIRVRNRKTTQVGSALLAQSHSSAPFSKLIFCDIDAENTDALAKRTAGDARVQIVQGDCNLRIEDVAAAIPEHGLNIALIDPFGPKQLRWSTIERLARFKRMDLLIHFPTYAIKRNFLNANEFESVIDDLVGTEAWRERVRASGDVTKLIDVLREQLASVGYEGERVRTLQVTNTQSGVLYHLVFASKDQRGTAIWKSITKNDGAQRGLGFDV